MQDRNTFPDNLSPIDLSAPDSSRLDAAVERRTDGAKDGTKLADKGKDIPKAPDSKPDVTKAHDMDPDDPCAAGSRS